PRASARPQGSRQVRPAGRGSARMRRQCPAFPARSRGSPATSTGRSDSRSLRHMGSREFHRLTQRAKQGEQWHDHHGEVTALDFLEQLHSPAFDTEYSNAAGNFRPFDIKILFYKAFIEFSDLQPGDLAVTP